MRLIEAILLVLCLAMSGVAQAQDPGEWAGLPLAGVQLEAPEGGLPEESLDPLLRAVQGEPLDMGVIRLDLATLFRVGSFRSVEAHGEPWVSFDENGDPVDAVLLTYKVYPAPTVGKLDVTGNKTFRDRDILELAGVNIGQGAWFPDLEADRLADRIERGLYRQGWIRAQVEVEVIGEPQGALEILIHVEEGQPNVLEHLDFAGDIDGVLSRNEHAALYRWARKSGVVQGEPFAPDAITRAQDRIRSELAKLDPGPFRQRRGWVSARVTPALIRTGAGTARLTYTIEPGPRLQLDVEGMGRRGERIVTNALGIDERLRLTRGWLDEAPDKLTTALQNEGYLTAQVTVTLDEPDEGQLVLRVQAERGSRHSLPTGTYPGFIGIDFVDNTALSDADLQRVIDQASDQVLRRDYFTEDELRKGILACEELYRAHGYLDAELALVQTEVKPRGWWPVRVVLGPFRRLFGVAPPLKVQPQVAVREGPLTTLESATIAGAAEAIDLHEVESELRSMRGTAYSPHRLEALTREVVYAHRNAGYLEVDAAVDSVQIGDRLMRTTLVIDPGPRVLLRSKVTRGLRLTHAPFVRREADLELGEPVTSEALERIRTNLYDLGVFRSVRLELLGDGPNRDLVVDVTERPRWAYEWGFGLSTDQGLRSFGRVTRRNLWGRAHRVDIVGQVGLEYGTGLLPDLFSGTPPEWRVVLTYRAPRFPTRQQDLILELLARERRLERTWRMARTGGGPSLETRLSSRSTLVTGVRLETRQLQEVDAGALLTGEAWDLLTEVSLPTSWRVQEQMSASLVHDRRDDPALPSRGWMGSVSGEWAPGLPWDEWRGQPVAAFVKTQVRLTTWIPLGGFGMRLAGTGGQGWSTNGAPIPLEDRFRLGGTGSLRGFQLDSIGPRNLAPRVAVDWPSSLKPLLDYATRDEPERWVPTGGESSVLGTAELILPLPALGMPDWDGYAAALFVDAGNVWLSGNAGEATSDEEPWRSLIPTLRWAVGGGMRVATPVGPLQFDIASNLQSLWTSGARRALLVDAWEEPPWRVHLTLGATF